MRVFSVSRSMPTSTAGSTRFALDDGIHPRRASGRAENSPIRATEPFSSSPTPHSLGRPPRRFTGLWARSGGLESNPVAGRRASWAGRVREQSTGASDKLPEDYRFLSIGMSYKVPVVFGAIPLQSARGFSYKVPVDNSRIPPTYPRSGALEEGRGVCCGAASPRDRPGPLWRLGRTAGPA